MRLIQLTSETTRCTIAPDAGGRLMQLEVRLHDDAWTPLLLSPDDPSTLLADPMSWGCFLMAPWPNRIAHGTFSFRGSTYHVPVNLEGHAVHGLGFDRAWQVEGASASSCRMSLAFDGRWPFGGGAAQEIRVDASGIAQRVEVHADDQPFPAGVGWHPWFRRRIDRVEAPPGVCVDAAEIYELDGMIPTGRLLPVSGDTDLRDCPQIGDRRLDTLYRHPVRLLRIRWGPLQLALRSSANVTHAVVYTPERGICIEPQTCAIDAFNMDEGVGGDAGTLVVEPSQPLIATTEWSWSYGNV